MQRPVGSSNFATFFVLIYYYYVIIFHLLLPMIRNTVIGIGNGTAGIGLSAAEPRLPQEMGEESRDKTQLGPGCSTITPTPG